jgi:hypothetical protein
MQRLYKRSTMRRISVLISFFAVSQLFSYRVSGQQFTAGRLVVERVGTGIPQTDVATPIFLDEYTITGVPGVSIAMPTSTVPPINQTTESGTVNADGMLTRSVDGNYLVVPGYDAAVGTPAIESTPTNKVITRVDASGNMASTVLVDGSTYSGNNFRSVVTTDGSQYWLSGAGNGAINVLHQGSTTPVAGTEISTTITDNRSMLIYNNQLYQSTATGLIRVFIM